MLIIGWGPYDMHADGHMWVANRMRYIWLKNRAGVFVDGTNVHNYLLVRLYYKLKPDSNGIDFSEVREIIIG